MRFTIVFMSLFLMSGISAECQSIDDSKTSNEDFKLIIPLTLKTLNNYPDFLILNSTPGFSLPEYYMFQNNEIKSSLNLNIKKINTQLLYDFKQQMDWQKRQDLGLFGKYLGYAMSAAAAGLAISHIVKYKENALIGR